jgi:16S rRNA processing protein RimM
VSRNPEDTSDRVSIARVLTPHGLRGGVKVHIEPALFAQLDSIGPLTAETENGRVSLEVEKAALHGSTAVIEFLGIDDRDDAMALRGAWLTVESCVLAPLGEKQYYRSELAGMEAVDTHGGTIGTVTRIDEFPAHDVLVIDAGEAEFWVPAVAEFIVDVDTAGRRIVIDRWDEFPSQPKGSAR